MANFTKSLLCSAALAATALVSVAAPASAGDLFGRRDGGSIKDAPAEEPRRCSFSMNVGGTTDYVFRGISQSMEDPAVQGGVDATCGIFYAGVWASGIDFVKGNGGPGSGDANIEVDLYAGIKPTWGPLTFDLGVIYYAYPGAEDGAPLNLEADYVELKAGVSGTWNNFTLGATLFWSPEYTFETGNTLTAEGSIGYTFSAIGPVTPTVNALVGTVQSLDTGSAQFDYTYWNAGLALAVDKFTFDFRYWDTDLDTGLQPLDGLADERFVFTAKVTLP